MAPSTESRPVDLVGQRFAIASGSKVPAKIIFIDIAVVVANAGDRHCGTQVVQFLGCVRSFADRHRCESFKHDGPCAGTRVGWNRTDGHVFRVTDDGTLAAPSGSCGRAGPGAA